MKTEPVTIREILDQVADTDLHRRLLVDLAGPPRRLRMTYEEFLEWADEDTLAEWVNGEVIMTSPASKKHQSLVRFLTAVLSVFVEDRDLGVILPAPFQMRLAHTAREPDLLFVATPNLARLKATYLEGPADLVVEITSPESLGRDRGDKFYEYAEGGIPEYWLFDPEHERAEFYRLDNRGTYQLVMLDDGGIYRSDALPGFWLRVSWLWAPPPVLEVLRELQVLS